MFRVVIPQIFENMEEATVGKWLVQEGDAIAIDDPLCELITEKTTLDLKAEAAGTLLRLVVPEKAVIPAGYIVALIGEPGAALPDVDAENAAALARKTELPAADPGAEHATSAGISGLNVPSIQIGAAKIPAPSAAPAAGSRVRATPAARRAAKDAGVDIEAVAAAFPGKVLSEEDVRSFAANQ
jgi:pyruvate dehydrogenase E2 component (dihydrolipoamide acetyltransferase)